MPDGKPAGQMCVNLDPGTFRCRIWNAPDYPAVCRGLQAEPQMCGTSREEALAWLTELERLTRPSGAYDGERPRTG